MRALAKVSSSGGEVDLTTWSLAALAPLSVEQQEVVLAAATEAIRLALAEPAQVWFCTGDKLDGCALAEPRDPLAMRIELPLGKSDYDNPSWSFNLADAVEAAIAELEGGANAGRPSHSILRLRNSLASLISKLDAAASGPQPTTQPTGCLGTLRSTAENH
jgi:hypothetical protein